MPIRICCLISFFPTLVANLDYSSSLLSLVSVSTGYLLRTTFLGLSNASCTLSNLSLIDISIASTVSFVDFSLASTACVMATNLGFNLSTVTIVEVEHDKKLLGS